MIMNNFKTQVDQLILPFKSESTQSFFDILHRPDVQIKQETPENNAHRSSIAYTLSAILFAQLVQNVPESQKYLQRVHHHHLKLVLDHGALRTVAWGCGALPPGESAFTRFLSALGYELAGIYPLPKLKMTGRSYAQRDDAQNLAQYFLSELHPEQFSEKFQISVGRVMGSCVDPLKPKDIDHLEQLRRDHHLPFEKAVDLLSALVKCFGKQHDRVHLEDYETLLSESPEMAWISTEGHSFNHATDRVENVLNLSAQLRDEHYSVKPQVEISKNGRVRQTAIKAAQVEREFLDGAHIIKRKVPGSFFEFISRDPLEASNPNGPLDLSFDSGNATGIFKMTQADAA
jgi:Domain of unknown function (DUF1338)